MKDIAIIGSGPAGLSAAITAKVRNKDIIVFGRSEGSEKVIRSHEIQNYLGIPAVSGAELAEKFRTHAGSMGVEITEDRITSVYAMGEYFALQGASGDMYEAKKVILAAGVTSVRPLPGENELLGRGVSYCATCDAPLYRNRPVAVIAYSPKEEAEARFLSEVCSKVLYFPVYKAEPDLPDSVEVIRETPASVEAKGLRERAVATENGEYTVDCVFILRDSVAPSNLVPGLETDGASVKVDRQMRTNIPGLFACGDITGRPYQLLKAAGEGNIAALSAAE